MGNWVNLLVHEEHVQARLDKYHIPFLNTNYIVRYVNLVLNVIPKFLIDMAMRATEWDTR